MKKEKLVRDLTLERKLELDEIITNICNTLWYNKCGENQEKTIELVSKITKLSRIEVFNYTLYKEDCWDIHTYLSFFRLINAWNGYAEPRLTEDLTWLNDEWDGIYHVPGLEFETDKKNIKILQEEK